MGQQFCIMGHPMPHKCMGTSQMLRLSESCLQNFKLSARKRMSGLRVAGAIEAASNSETSTTQLVQGRHSEGSGLSLPMSDSL